MSKVRKLEDYRKGPTFTITLSVPASERGVLEQFAQETNQPLGEIISRAFQDFAIPKIRKMLANEAKSVAPNPIVPPVPSATSNSHLSTPGVTASQAANRAAPLPPPQPRTPDMK